MRILLISLLLLSGCCKTQDEPGDIVTIEMKGPPLKVGDTVCYLDKWYKVRRVADHETKIVGFLGFYKTVRYTELERIK